MYLGPVMDSSLENNGLNIAFRFIYAATDTVSLPLLQSQDPQSKTAKLLDAVHVFFFFFF